MHHPRAPHRGPRTALLWSVSRLILLWLLLLLLAPLPLHAEEEYEPGLRVTPAGLSSFLESLRPTEVRDAQKYFDEVLKKELAGFVDADKPIDLTDGPTRKIMTKVVKLYQYGGFEVVKKLAKDGSIDIDSSSAIAAFRNAMVQEAIAELSQKYGEIRVNDFSSALNAQSDIDQTFFPVLEEDPRTKEKFIVEHAGEKKPLLGGLVKKEFNKLYEHLYEIHPEHMEVSSHAAEATIPDWRQHPDTVDFALKLAQGSEALRGNAEAYFLEAAFRRQVDRRSFQSDERLFRIFRPTRTGKKGGDILVVRLRSGAEGEVEHSRARYEVYRETRPEWRKGYAFGATVGNMLFAMKHGLPEEVAERAKYLMRSMEDGMASLALTEDSRERLYFDLPPNKRARMLRLAYPDLSATELRKVFVLYQIAEGVRTNRARLSSVEVRKKVFAPILLELVAEKWKDKPASLESIPPRQLNRYLREAQKRFEARNRAQLMENAVRAAGPRIRDWLHPDKIEVERIPPRFREKFKQNPQAFYENLRLSALSEIHDSFAALDPKIVDRIIAAEPNATHRAALADVKRCVELKKRLVRARKLREFFLTEPTAQIRQAAERLGSLGRGFQASWRNGDYRRPPDFTRMKNLVKEKVGAHLHAEFDKAVKSAKGPDGKWDSGKVAGKVANLGNADSIIQIIRAGQESGWDTETMIYAAGFELISNCPGVAPALAVKGALFDGEFEGAAVLVVGYFWPGFGQAYLIYNVAKGVVEMVDFAITRGLSDLVYQGYAYRPEDEGYWGYVFRYSPGRLAQDWVVSSNHAAPPTLLHFVPGGGFARKRLNMFGYFDPMITKGLAAGGVPEREWDPHRERRADPFFAKWVNDFADLRRGTPFGDDPAIRRRFEEIQSSLGGGVLDWYLDRPSVRQGLVTRLKADYMLGLQRKRLADGQKEMEEYEERSDECADLLDRVGGGLRALGAETRSDLGLVSGLPCFLDLDEEMIDRALAVDTESEPRLEILAPDEGIKPGDLGMLRGEVYAPPGRFAKPYDYDWEFVEAGEKQELGEHKGLTFRSAVVRGRKSVTVRMTVTDRNGLSIGVRERVVPFGEEGDGQIRVAAKHVLAKVVITTYSAKGKRRGERLDVIRESRYFPLRTDEVEDLDAAQARLRETLTASFGPETVEDWRGTLNFRRAVRVGWTIELEEGELPAGFKPSDVPRPKREVQPGGGPEW